MVPQLPEKSVDQRIRQLIRQRNAILVLPAQEALQRIQAAAQPAALVHCLAEEDLYFLIHELGADDALPLLAMASDKQLEFIFDLETWHRDRIDLASLTRWMMLLLQSDPRRALRWLSEVKCDLLQYYLSRCVEVQILEHDQDPSDLDDAYFTFDGVCYVRARQPWPAAVDPEPADVSGQAQAAERARQQQFLQELLQRLADTDHGCYLETLAAASSVIAAESEEEAFRLRTVRLAEKGFLPFDEALAIYQPLKPGALPRHRKILASPAGKASADVDTPHAHMTLLEPENLFTRALMQVDPLDARPRLQAEFASLCNQIIVADQKPIHERAQLGEVVRKACGYLNLGLERATQGRGGEDPRLAAAWLARHRLIDLFRVGFGAVMELKWRAERWLETAWFARRGLPLTFWGESWMGVLGGILLKKPLFFDNFEQGVLYREFFTTEDLRITANTLESVFAADRLLDKTQIQPNRFTAPGLLTYQNLLLTLWARNFLDLEPVLKPIAVPDFKRFYEGLFAEGPSPQKSAGIARRKTRASMQEHFMRWLAEAGGMDLHAFGDEYRSILEGLFMQIENELGSVSPESLDPRFIYLFFVQPE